MSESTVPHDGKCVEAGGRAERIATIEDVCSLVTRAASTVPAQPAHTDPIAAGAAFAPVRGSMRVQGAVSFGVVTAR